MRDVKEILADILGVDPEEVLVRFMPLTDSEVVKQHEQLHRDYWLLMQPSPSDMIH